MVPQSYALQPGIDKMTKLLWSRSCPTQAPAILLLALAVLCFFAVAAQGQTAFSEVTVINGGNAGILPPAGFTRIEADLNAGAGGDYIYACYKRGNGTPITGLAVTEGATPENDPAKWTRIPVDLNRNAGGADIFLWYTKDPDCSEIIDLIVLVGSGAVAPEGYTKFGFDLNRGAGGATLVFAYKVQ